MLLPINVLHVLYAAVDLESALHNNTSGSHVDDKQQKQRGGGCNHCSGNDSGNSTSHSPEEANNQGPKGILL